VRGGAGLRDQAVGATHRGQEANELSHTVDKTKPDIDAR
jgi:hypothetical protein